MLDVTTPGRALAQRFAQLGSMTGKTANQIISAVASPNSRSSMAFGKTLLRWPATGYHIAILFDVNGVFEKIADEYANLQPEVAPSDETDSRVSKYILIVAGVLLTLVILIRVVWSLW
jgi:hypothetical protein